MFLTTSSAAIKLQRMTTKSVIDGCQKTREQEASHVPLAAGGGGNCQMGQETVVEMNHTTHLAPTRPISVDLDRRRSVDWKTKRLMQRSGRLLAGPDRLNLRAYNHLLDRLVLPMSRSALLVKNLRASRTSSRNLVSHERWVLALPVNWHKNR